jgi:hypothetical protein
MRPGVAKMSRRHHGPKRQLDRTSGIGQKTGDAGERLNRFGVQHMKSGADQKCVAGFLPNDYAVRRSDHLGNRGQRPVEPNPPPPRPVDDSSVTATSSARATGAITIWAMRSPRLIVNGSAP